jgi:peptide/nickel transport system substrate-binding protein
LRRTTSTLSIFSLVCLAVVSCAPTASVGSQTPSQPARSTPKRMIGAIQSDPSVLTNTLVISSGQPGVPEIAEMVHQGLTDDDPEGTRLPFLAEAVPSLENGQWKLLADGKMDTSWSVKPGVTWHDGTPFTMDDLLFTLDFVRDTTFIEFNNTKFRLISGADVDGRTITVHWSGPLIDADALFTRAFASPLPKHLIEPLIRDDKIGYKEWSYWNTQFVGTGGYKIKDFIRGEHLTLAAFDSYIMGRPKIDEIEVKFIPDSNTRMANVLANAIDLTIGRDVALDQAVQAKDQWKDGHAETYTGSWFGIHPQLLNYSPSIVGNVQFREALLRAVDRQNMVDNVLYGQSSVPHAWLAPAEGQYWDIHDKVTHYEYDPRRAEQMVADLGFTRRADGFFYDGAGQRLTVELRTTGDNASHVKGIFPIADYWQRIGVATEPVVIPVQRQQDAEYRATYPGFQALRGSAGTSGMQAVLSSRSGLPENNFRASGNYSRYMDPAYDALYERFTRAIPIAERKQLVEQAMRLFAEQQIKMGIFYDAASTMINNRLLNIQARRVAWNSHLWDLK